MEQVGVDHVGAQVLKGAGDGLLDTGADETILDPSIAPLIGVDLSQAVEREVNLVGRVQIRCRYTSVKLWITAVPLSRRASS